MRPHRWQPTRLPHSWDSQGKNTGVGCHFLLQCMKVKSKSEVAQSCPTLPDPMDCSPPGSSIHGIFQSRVLEWVAIAFSANYVSWGIILKDFSGSKCSSMNIYNIKRSTDVPNRHTKRGNLIIIRGRPGEQVDLAGGYSWLKHHKAILARSV